MESLLCDEDWLSSLTETDQKVEKSSDCISSLNVHEYHSGKCHLSKEDCQQALTISLEEDKSFVPDIKYIEYLASKNLIVARFKSIQWFIKCQSRLNLSIETVFYAVNYLDHFISAKQHSNIEWKYWMVELISVACFSIASKFNDTTTPSLHEINQMEDMKNLFEPSTIQRMELMILQALDWRLACTTAYSYVEMFTCTLYMTFKPHHYQEVTTQVNHLLLRAISDTKMLEFRPSVVAFSALWCCLDNLHFTAPIAFHSSLTGFFNQDQKDDLVRCHKMMEMQWIGTGLNNHKGPCYNYCPSSPTTVLLRERVNILDFNVDLSLFHIQRRQVNLDQSRSRKKLRRSEELYMN